MTDQYDFWLFDLDGTLVDIDPSYPQKVLTAVGDRLGVGFDTQESMMLWYGLGGARETVLDDKGIAPEQFWAVFHEEENPHARARATYLYEDAERFLATRTEPMGLVTHCQEYLTDPVLDHLGIGDWFETVICCDDDIGWKPNPRPVRLAMQELGVIHNRHTGVLAGDNPDDIGAAWNAGLDGIHVQRRPQEEHGYCVMGDHRVESLLDLRESW